MTQEVYVERAGRRDRETASVAHGAVAVRFLRRLDEIPRVR